MIMRFRLPCAASALAGLLLASGPALAKNVDLIFVIDQSGSMAGEFVDLGDNLAVVFNGLTTSPEITSLQAGLVTYEGSGPGSITLQQGLTDDATVLQNAFAGVQIRGGTEQALSAVDAAVPGGNASLGISYRPNAVRSAILITDENADDAFSYTYAGQTGYGALGQLMDDTGFLLNIITAPSLFDDFAPSARPAGTPDDPFAAIFDLTAFNADPATFLAEFAAAKLEEIIVTEPTDPVFLPVPDAEAHVIPLPATAWLLGAAMLGLGGIGHLRRET